MRTECAAGCGRPSRRHKMCTTCWAEVPAELRRDVVHAFQSFRESVRRREPQMRDRAGIYRMARDAAIGSIR